MGKPWLIEDIYRYFSGEEPLVHSGIDYRDILLEHLDHIVSYQNERRALLDLRRIGCWFLRGAKNMRTAAFATKVSHDGYTLAN